MTATRHWSEDVHRVLRDWQISVVATIPDAGLTQLLALCDRDADIRTVTLSSEEEGVGLGLGVWLGGQRALLCMQSSGVGNCINALALPASTKTPCLMLVTMRGQEGEGNGWQVPMGRATRTVMEAMGVHCLEARTSHEVGAFFGQAAKKAFERNSAAAVLVSQRVIGIKEFDR